MEIGMASKEYLIEIEVRKYTPKTIRSYRNNLNPMTSGKMLHKLKTVDIKRWCSIRNTTAFLFWQIFM